jgi:hypothetical protein
MFRMTRNYIPDSDIIINHDFLPTTAPSNKNFINYVSGNEELIALDSPYDGIGYQAHFYTRLPTFMEGDHIGGQDSFRMKEIEKGLDLLAGTGKPIHITEFNPPSRSKELTDPQASLSDEEIAAWAANFYTLVFSKTYVEEIIHWFLIDGCGGRGIDAGLFDEDGTPKPQYYAIEQLLTKNWSTELDEELINGEVNISGFYGTYEAKVDGYKNVTFEIMRDGPDIVEISLESLKPVCDDGTCDSNENCLSCPHDCTCHRADTDGDGCVGPQELNAFIDHWYLDSTGYPMGELMEAVGLWKSGAGCPT